MSINKWLNKGNIKYIYMICISVQFSHSVVSDSLQPIDYSTPGFPVHHQIPELAQTHGHQVSDVIQPSHSLSSLSLTAFKLSQHEGLFKWVISSHQVAKGLMLQLQHQSFQWIFLGLISFRIDWLDLLVVQGTLKSLLQHHSSKALILGHSVFFMVQLSHPFMTTGKTITLTRRSFVGKVMSLLFNMLSRFVIAFLPRSNCFLIVHICTYVYDMYDLYLLVWYVYICDMCIYVICKYIHIVE